MLPLFAKTQKSRDQTHFSIMLLVWLSEASTYSVSKRKEWSQVLEQKLPGIIWQDPSQRRSAGCPRLLKVQCAFWGLLNFSMNLHTASGRTYRITCAQVVPATWTPLCPSHALCCHSWDWALILTVLSGFPMISLVLCLQCLLDS